MMDSKTQVVRRYSIWFGSLYEGDQMNIYHDESLFISYRFGTFILCFPFHLWIGVLFFQHHFTKESDYHHDQCYLNDTLNIMLVLSDALCAYNVWHLFCLHSSRVQNHIKIPKK